MTVRDVAFAIDPCKRTLCLPVQVHSVLTARSQWQFRQAAHAFTPSIFGLFCPCSVQKASRREEATPGYYSQLLDRKLSSGSFCGKASFKLIRNKCENRFIHKRIRTTHWNYQNGQNPSASEIALINVRFRSVWISLIYTIETIDRFLSKQTVNYANSGK